MSGKAQPDWDEVHNELKRKGVTLQLLCDEYRNEHPDGYGYSQFCELYRKWKRKISCAMKQRHKAGEKMFVDYAGQTVEYFDSGIGEKKRASIFVAVLGASNFTYAEAQESENTANWICGHVRALEYFGGVPEQVVPDNLKVGVKSPCYYEPEINPAYLEMARYYHTAVIPARIKKPKDKAKVEVGVQVVERWILAVLRKRQFLSLGELNVAIRELLEILNLKKMKHLGKSRRELWESLERSELKPLPDSRYEYADWKMATVGIDYHVRVGHNSYSVPYRFSGQGVNVRIGEKSIEIFHQGRSVALHVRSHEKNQAITKKEHMPEKHNSMLSWTPERFLRWAEKIGPQTREMIERIMARREYPEQGYRKCLGILKQADRYGAERLEGACRRGLSFGIFSYRGIKEILENGYDRLAISPETEEEKPKRHENIRGAEYYGLGEEKC